MRRFSLKQLLQMLQGYSISIVISEEVSLCKVYSNCFGEDSLIVFEILKSKYSTRILFFQIYNLLSINIFMKF